MGAGDVLQDWAIAMGQVYDEDMRVKALFSTLALRWYSAQLCKEEDIIDNFVSAFEREGLSAGMTITMNNSDSQASSPYGIKLWKDENYLKLAVFAKEWAAEQLAARIVLELKREGEEKLSGKRMRGITGLLRNFVGDDDQRQLLAALHTDADESGGSPPTLGDATKAAIFSIVERHGSRWKDTLSPTPDAVINDLRVVEPELFGRLEPRVLPADNVEQGALGDCWLLAALTILAGAGRIRPLIVQIRDDVFAVQFYRTDIDEWEVVVVDAFFPVLSSSISHEGPTDERHRQHAPLFGHSKVPELWVMVLEKAYAKFCRPRRSVGYRILEGGLLHEALVALTGGAAEEIKLMGLSPGDQETVWIRLVYCLRAGHLLGASSLPGEDTTNLRGIVLGHAYAVLDARTCLVNGRELRMVKLRNPWGRNPWNEGYEWESSTKEAPLDWTPKSKLWQRSGSSLMKKLLDYDPELDLVAKPGVFWIRYSALMEFFSSISICRIMSATDGWHKAQVSGRWVPSNHGEEDTAGGYIFGHYGYMNPQYLLTVSSPGPAFFTLIQADSDYTSRYIMLTIVRRSTKFEERVYPDLKNDPTFECSGVPKKCAIRVI